MSVPAEIRRRWAARVLEVEDFGDHVVVRPAPDDPLDAVTGIFAGRGRDAAEHRDAARREEAEAESRRAP